MTHRWWLLSSALVLGACASGGSMQTKAIAKPTTPPAPAQNPFAGAKIYGDPEFAKMVARVPAATPEDAARMKKLATFPVAFWLESLATAKLAGPALDELAKQQAAGGEPLVPTFVVYNLPNRDCSAAGSRGELSVDKNGEALYQTQFIDVIAAAFKAHPNQKITVVLEPDSLGNLVTNMAVPTCAAAEQIYRRGMAYAIATLSLPNVYIYVDGAHAGWLGWPKNLPKGAQLFKEVLDVAGGADRIRGFAINVSNYDPPRDPNGAKRIEPRRPEPGRARLRRRSERRARQAGGHRQGLHHRHQPQRQGVHPLDARQLVQRQGRRPRRAPARRAGAERRRFPVDQDAGRIGRHRRPQGGALRRELRLRRRHARRPRGRRAVRPLPARPREERHPAAVVERGPSPCPLPAERGEGTRIPFSLSRLRERVGERASRLSQRPSLEQRRAREVPRARAPFPETTRPAAGLTMPPHSGLVVAPATPRLHEPSDWPGISIQRCGVHQRHARLQRRAHAEAAPRAGCTSPARPARRRSASTGPARYGSCRSRSASSRARRPSCSRSTRSRSPANSGV